VRLLQAEGEIVGEVSVGSEGEADAIEIDGRDLRRVLRSLQTNVNGRGI